MKLQFYILLIIYYSLVLLSCSSKNKSFDSPVDKVGLKTMPTIFPIPEPDDIDPYFVGNNILSSPIGPQVISRNLIEDKKGSIWFATWDGIVQYKDDVFTNFTNKDGLRRYRMFSLVQDRNGIIWFGSQGAGVYRYDGTTFKNITTKDGLINDKIGWIKEDSKGNKWFGTLEGLSKYDGKSFTNYTTTAGGVNNDINGIIEDKEGIVWIATRGGVFKLIDNSLKEVMNSESKPWTNVRSLMLDKKDNIWLGGQDGLWKYDGKILKSYTSNFTGNVYEDRKGNIWYTSDTPKSRSMGLFMLSKKNLQVANPLATEMVAPKGQIYGIIEDRKGNIWFGKSDGIGRYDGKGFEYFR